MTPCEFQMNVSGFKSDGTLPLPPPAETLKVKRLDLERLRRTAASIKEDLRKGKMPTTWLNGWDGADHNACLKKECEA